MFSGNSFNMHSSQIHPRSEKPWHLHQKCFSLFGWQLSRLVLKSNNIKNSKHLISIWEAAVLFYIGEGRFLCSLLCLAYWGPDHWNLPPVPMHLGELVIIQLMFIRISSVTALCYAFYSHQLIYFSNCHFKYEGTQKFLYLAQVVEINGRAKIFICLLQQSTASSIVFSCTPLSSCFPLLIGRPVTRCLRLEPSPSY